MAVVTSATTTPRSASAISPKRSAIVPSEPPRPRSTPDVAMATASGATLPAKMSRMIARFFSAGSDCVGERIAQLDAAADGLDDRAQPGVDRVDVVGGVGELEEDPCVGPDGLASCHSGRPPLRRTAR